MGGGCFAEGSFVLVRAMRDLESCRPAYTLFNELHKMGHRGGECVWAATIEALRRNSPRPQDFMKELKRLSSAHVAVAAEVAPLLQTLNTGRKSNPPGTDAQWNAAWRLLRCLPPTLASMQRLCTPNSVTAVLGPTTTKYALMVYGRHVPSMAPDPLPTDVWLYHASPDDRESRLSTVASYYPVDVCAGS